MISAPAKNKRQLSALNEHPVVLEFCRRRRRQNVTAVQWTIVWYGEW